MNRTDRIKQLYGKRSTSGRTNATTGKATGCSVHLSDQTLSIVLPSAKKSLVQDVKRLHGRKYLQDQSTTRQQMWTAPLTLDTVKKLKSWGFQLCKKTEQWLSDTLALPTLDPNFKIDGLRQKLDPDQIEGVQLIDHFVRKQNGVLMADDMGMGKTGMVLAWLSLYPKKRPVLIVCPAFIKQNWRTEIEFWIGKHPKVQIIYGTEQQLIWGEYVIVNYDILTTIQGSTNQIRPDLWNVDWQVVIADEAHRIGGDLQIGGGNQLEVSTIRGWAVDQLIRDAVFIAITATPGMHRPKNYFPILHMINSRIFPSFYQFAHRYCGAKKTPWGWNFNGSTNEGELHELLKQTMMIRRVKPDDQKSREVVVLEIDNREEYDRAEREEELVGFGQVEKLKQLAVKGMLSSAIKFVENMLEQNDKLVVFAHHKTTIDALAKAFPGISVVVDGRTPDKLREHAKHEFQRCARCGIRKEKHAFEKQACSEYVPNMECRLFFGSEAAVEGNTLTASWHVIFIELWDSPLLHEQAEDRCYMRRGDAHGITAWYLVAQDTIMISKARQYDLKNRSLKKVMNGKNPSKKMLLTELIKLEQERISHV